PVKPEGPARGSIDVLVTHVHYLFLEAEAGASSSIVDDPLASGGRCISTSVGSDGAAFVVEIPVDGNYALWCRILTRSPGPNPAVVSVDEGPGVSDATLDVPVAGTWSWSRVCVPSTGSMSGSTPLLMPLNAGTHAVRLGLGRSDTTLDCVLLTDDSSTNP